MKFLKKTLLPLSVMSILIFTASCSTESADQQDMNTEMSIFKTLDLAAKNSNSTDADSKAPAPKKGEDPIAQIAIDNGGFTQLVDALKYVDEELNAGLVDLFLNGTDQYTVFAPTDEAFAKLYEALNISSIRELPADLVLNVLLYHVTDGRRASNSVVPKKNMRYIDTLLGESFSVDSNAKITAIGNTATIIAADISASNGIIHVIDTVLLPM
ncbi:hypothetical protein C7S20_03120 [Christiangramia fulva]|uniref:FAS1 domain-containing protein n=1 Tax=Christiangramia fulva TaxID=2126553 RepID=A0A2R3Z261_9FLAO|nr:fasciclin domain-containing protein [Christiangramia fulva]AVR44329.1 hypothetical protein C7S20_03120 [Christiangramia fulva]